jgi:macrolide transport system ATP-binding/permease protein
MRNLMRGSGDREATLNVYVFGTRKASRHSTQAECAPTGNVEPRVNGLASDRLAEAARLALLSILAHRLRSFLTMLGIIIGVVSVICVVALGEGSQQQVLEKMRAFGSNTIQIIPGRTAGDSNEEDAR